MWIEISDADNIVHKGWPPANGTSIAPEVDVVVN
jgi:hypothetical protein